MNIRDLQYLIAVHDLNSFSKAAEKCFVSQPTLSGQLKKLEEQLGAPLMERTTRQVFFTPFGEEVVSKARDVVQKIVDIQELAKYQGDELTGDFNIGLIPTVGPSLLPLILPELTKQFPKINFFLYELQTGVLLEKLQNAELDAIILAKLDWDVTANEISLYKERMLLAVNHQHKLALSNKQADLNMLANESVLMLEDGHCLRDQALGVCFSAGAREDHRFQATSMDTLLHMVASGIGITLIPELAANDFNKKITYLRFNDPQPMREIVMLYRKSSVRRPALEVIANSIVETLAK